MGFLFEILHSLDSRVGKFSTEKMEFATELIAGFFLDVGYGIVPEEPMNGQIYLIGAHRLSLGRSEGQPELRPRNSFEGLGYQREVFNTLKK